MFPLISPPETMETLMEGGMAVLRNGGVACRSTTTFHSGSLRDGIHYMAAEKQAQTDEREKLERERRADVVREKKERKGSD